MYSDSDDSQVSQPHLYNKMKTKKPISELVKPSRANEDVVDKERTNLINLDYSSTNLIDIDDEQLNQTFNSSYKSPRTPIDKLLMKSSSDSKSSELSTSKSSSETSLGENYEVEEEEEKKYFNKSQQTSPTLFGSSSKLLFSKQLESWPDLNKYESIETLESPVHSPEIKPLKSKYLKYLQLKQGIYFDSKQSIESLDTNTRIDKLELESRFSTRYDSRQDITLAKRSQYGIFNFDFDEELFYKIKKLFPQVSDERIRTFMFKHHNQEHDVIAATINSLSPKREKRFLKNQTKMDKVLGHYIRTYREINQSDEEKKRLLENVEINEDPNYAKVEMRIQYLKLLYPESDSLELFYLLHENDMKANLVAKKLEELGFKRKSLSESEESLANSLHFEELMPELKLTFGEQQNRLTILKKEYSYIDDYLVKTALKSTKFNLNEARKLLDTVDINEYKNIKTYEFKWLINDSEFINVNDRSTQTCPIDYFEFGRDYKIKRKEKKNVKTKNQSTWTKEDNMEKIVIKKLAIGPNPNNYKGIAKKEKTILIKPKGPNPKNYIGQNPLLSKGSNSYLSKGSDSKNLLNIQSLAIGSDSNNCRGSIKVNPREESEYELIKNLFININIGL